MEEKSDRIPELEEELVAAATRLRSPRRVLRPALHAALAAAVVTVAAVLPVVGRREERDGRRPQKTGTPPSQGGMKIGVDVQPACDSPSGAAAHRKPVLLDLERDPQQGRRCAIRATCGVAFAQVGPEGDPRNAREERTRFGPRAATGCFSASPRYLEACEVVPSRGPGVGNVGFVMFGPPARAPPRTRKIELIANEWARLFAASDPEACAEVHDPARLRADGLHARGEPADRNCTPPSPAFRRSFRGARVEEVAIQARPFGAGAKAGGPRPGLEQRDRPLMSVGQGPEQGGVWWIEKYQGNPGRGLFER